MSRLSNWFPWKRRRLERDLDRELRYHVDRRVDDLKRSGVDEAESRRRVTLEFGGVTQVREDVREAWLWRWLTQFLQDARYGTRALLRSPSFTLAAAASLGLAIGANTAIFSVIHGVLLKPLPYAAPHELVMVWQDMRAKGGPPDEWATPGNFVDWRAESRTFASMASIRGFAPTLVGMGDSQVLVGEQVTQGYFDVLGAKTEIGRVFRPEEAVPNAPRVVIISHRFWQERFGGAKSALDQQLMLSGESHQVVGVMPAGFRPIVNQNADVWRPDRLNLASPSRGAIVLRVVARLQPAMTPDGAQRAMTAVAADLARRYPESNSNVGINVVPLHEQVSATCAPAC